MNYHLPELFYPWGVSDQEPIILPLCGIVSIGRQSVAVYSDSNDVPIWLADATLRSELPDYSYDLAPQPICGQILYKVSMKDLCECNIESRTIRISGPEIMVGSGRMLHYMAYRLLEFDRQANQQATLHAAAASRDGRGVLLIGRQGAGKTSVVLELCRTYGFRLIAADLSFTGLNTDGGYLAGGSKWFSLRRTAIERNQPDLVQALPRPYQVSDSWNTKYLIFPEDVKIAVESKIVPISAAYFLRLTDQDSPFHLTPCEGVDHTNLIARLFLHELLTSYIRGTTMPVLAGHEHTFLHYPPMFDQPKFHYWRSEWIEWLLRTAELSYISGSLHDVCSHIISHLGRRSITT